MGKQRSRPNPEPPGSKRHRNQSLPNEEEATSSKRLLESNQYAQLPADDGTAAEEIEKKEKLPPFYVKGFPSTFRRNLDELISRGLRAKIRLCTDGYKIVVPSLPHFKAVQEFLRQLKAEYFTHDIAAAKPFKVVLRGLPDMDLNELKEELNSKGLKVEEIFKMVRHNKTIRYRDQLFLLHLTRGSTTLQEVKTITALFNIIVQWERYKPIHRDVTQCSNCLNFGHGTKNCHIKSRCMKCAGAHPTADCLAEETVKVKCLNCESDHPTNSRSCPKRTEFIQKRKDAANRQRTSNRNLPVLTPNPPTRQNIAPRPVPSSGSENSQPPGFLSYAQVASMPPATGLYSMEQLAMLFMELDRQTKACRTSQEQIAVMMTFYYRHGSISTNP